MIENNDYLNMSVNQLIGIINDLKIENNALRKKIDGDLLSPGEFLYIEISSIFPKHLLVKFPAFVETWGYDENKNWCIISKEPLRLKHIKPYYDKYINNHKRGRLYSAVTEKWSEEIAEIYEKAMSGILGF